MFDSFYAANTGQPDNLYKLFTFVYIILLLSSQINRVNLLYLPSENYSILAATFA